jgi:SAM-dependent methyltransferase
MTLKPDAYRGLAHLYDLMFSAQPSRAQELALLQSCCRLDVPSLELGCGTGRVLLNLLEAGFPVHGVDASPTMLDRLQAKATALGLSPITRLGDMRTFSLPDRFGCALLTQRAFHHLLTPDDQVACLRRVRAHLLPSAKLVIDCMSPSLHGLSQQDGARRRVPASLIDPASGAALVWSRERLYLEASQRLEWAEVIERHDPMTGALLQSWRWPLSLKVVFPHELEHLLARCGFRVVSRLGHYDRSPFTAQSPAMIYIAEVLPDPLPGLEPEPDPFT